MEQDNLFALIRNTQTSRPTEKIIAMKIQCIEPLLNFSKIIFSAYS